MEKTNKIILQCALSDNRTERLKYAAKAITKTRDMETAFDLLSDKLVQAGQTIAEQNELLECCYSALGERSRDIVSTWKTINKIKKERFKKGD